MNRKNLELFRNPKAFLAVVCAALMIFFCGQTYAQIDVGSVTGTVKDQSGAVVRGAQLTLTNTDTNLAQSTVSTASGAYVFEAVPPGSYMLKVSAAGFKESLLKNIQVHVQAAVTADISLQVGAINQQVTVSTQAPLLQAQDASLGQTVNTTTVNDLPLDGRNWMALTELAAGSYTPANTAANGTGTYFVNGAQAGQVDARLNGVDDNLEVYGGFNIAPIPDAIEEFKLQDGNNGAELGHSAGAVINASTKSGTNQFKGNVFEYFRNEFLNANDYFNNLHGTRRPEYRQNQIGGTLGGPVLLPHYNGRDKTFFFVDWQGSPHVTSTSFTDQIPTANMQSSGYTNLQDLINGQSGTATDGLGRVFPHGTVLDPATTRSVAAGAVDSVTGLPNTSKATVYVRDPFYKGSVSGMKNFVGQTANLNTIPAGRLDANAIALLKLLPVPNVNGTILANNYYVAPTQSYIDNQFDVRVDERVTGKDSIFGTISHQFGNNDSAQPFEGIAGGALQLAFANVHSYYESTGSYTHVFSPTLINEVRFGWDQNYYENSIPGANTLGTPALYGIQGIPQFAGNGGLPTFNYSGGFSAWGGRRYSPTIQTTGAYDISENLTKIAGRHEFKTGFQYVRIFANIIQPSYSRGNFTWNGQFSDIPNASSGFTAPADMLLTPIASTAPASQQAGVSNYLGGLSGYNGANYAGTDYLSPYYGVYAQDNWKVTPDLTLTAGLRWEYFSPYSEIHGNQANFIMSGSGNGPSGTYYIAHGGCNTPRSAGFNAMLAGYNIAVQCMSGNTVNNAQKTNFAPRLGVSYRIFPNLVARAGFGIAYGSYDSVGYGGTLGTNYPFQYTLNNPSSTSQSPLLTASGQTATMENIFGSIDLQNPLSLSGLGLGLSGKQFNYNTPYTESVNLTLQYQFTQRDSIQVGYVGTMGVHLDSGSADHNSNTEILPPGTNASAYTPFPNITINSEYIATAFVSNYQSMQAVYQHQFSGGFNILGNYTFGKCMTNAQGENGLANGSGQSLRAYWLPGFGAGRDYALCADDATHLAHVSGEYVLPFGKGNTYLSNANNVEDALVGGWHLNFIYTGQSGQPVNIGCPVATTASSNFGCNATLAPGVSPYAGLHNRVQWLNPAAFVQPPAATAIGQSSLAPLGGPGNQVRGPGFYNVDASAFKQFRTSENTYLQFRIEAFNAFNHVQFQNPGTLNAFNSPTTFASITSDRSGYRIGQLVAKFYF